VVPNIKRLTEEFFNNIPAGVGSKSRIRASDKELDSAFLEGQSGLLRQGTEWKPMLKIVRQTVYRRS